MSKTLTFALNFFVYTGRWLSAVTERLSIKCMPQVRR